MLEFLFLVIVAIAILACVFGAKKRASYKRSKFPVPPPPQKPASQPSESPTVIPLVVIPSYEPEPLEIQFLNASMHSKYEPQILLNKTEVTIYWALIKLLKNHLYVNPQVSLGEILSCENNLGYRAINSKRADFVLTDKAFKPVAVIEFQGRLHFQGEYKIRDAIKFNALSRAGIKYIQLFESDAEAVKATLIKNGLLPNQTT